MAKPTLHDVAAKAGVSVTTTSMVLNGNGGRISDQTRQKIWNAARALGYERDSAAAALRTGTHDYILILMPVQPSTSLFESLLLDSPFFTDFLAGFEAAAAAKRQLFAVSRIAEAEELEVLVRGRRPRGALVLGKMTEAAMDVIGGWTVPTVVVDDHSACARYPKQMRLIDFHNDDARMGYLGMQHLLALGHRRIALLFGDLSWSAVHRSRYSGAVSALKEGGLDETAIDLVETVDVSFAAGEACCPALADAISKGATAILCMADILALGCHAGISRLGFAIPRDISLCGMDGLRLLNYLPYRLTTVDQGIVRRGARALALLFGDAVPDDVGACVRVGDTSAAPPAKRMAP